MPRSRHLSRDAPDTGRGTPRSGPNGRLKHVRRESARAVRHASRTPLARARVGLGPPRRRDSDSIEESAGELFDEGDYRLKLSRLEKLNRAPAAKCALSPVKPDVHTLWT